MTHYTKIIFIIIACFLHASCVFSSASKINVEEWQKFDAEQNHSVVIYSAKNTLGEKEGTIKFYQSANILDPLKPHHPISDLDMKNIGSTPVKELSIKIDGPVGITRFHPTAKQGVLDVMNAIKNNKNMKHILFVFYPHCVNQRATRDNEEILTLMKKALLGNGFKTEQTDDSPTMWWTQDPAKKWHVVEERPSISDAAMDSTYSISFTKQSVVTFR